MLVCLLILNHWDSTLSWLIPVHRQSSVLTWRTPQRHEKRFIVSVLARPWEILCDIVEHFSVSIHCNTFVMWAILPHYCDPNGSPVTAFWLWFLLLALHAVGIIAEALQMGTKMCWFFMERYESFPHNVGTFLCTWRRLKWNPFSTVLLIKNSHIFTSTCKLYLPAWSTSSSFDH